MPMQVVDRDATVEDRSHRTLSTPWRGWVPLVLLPALVLALTPRSWPVWALMWLLAFAIYCGCKWLTWRRTHVTATWSRNLAYLVAWPGMDAPSFLRTAPEQVAKPSSAQWLFALLKTTFGFALLYGVMRQLPDGHPYAVGWVGLIGLAMTLHFGLIHLLSCAWRSFGVNAQPLMRWPMAADSVSDFWGRRWNLAFRDLAHRFVFQPLTVRFGLRWAVLGGFFFSGIIHDLAISLPARAGYGLPTLYFMIQAAAIFFERSKLGKSLGLGRGWRSRVFAAVVVGGCAPLLFHPPFMNRIVLPFLHAIGALPWTTLG